MTVPDGLDGAGADPLAAPPEASASLGGLGRQSLVYAAGLLTSRLVAFLMLPVYTNYLSPADYGTLQLLLLTMDIFALAAGARIAGGIFYYHAKAGTSREKQQLLSTSLVLLGSTYAAAAVLVAALAPWLSNLVFGSPAHVLLIRLAAAAFLFEGLILVGLTCLQVRGLPKRYVAATLGRLAIQVVLNLVVLIGLSWGIEGMMGATVVANAITAGWLTTELLRRVGLSLSQEQVGNLVRFGIPLVGTQIAAMVAAYGDRYVLNAKSGADAVGVYSLALQFGVMVFSLGFVPFNQVWEPRRFDLARRPDRDVMYSRAFRFSNLLLISLGVGASLFVDDYLRAASSPAFRPAAALVPILVLAYVFQAWCDFQNLGIMMRERTSLIAAANWLSALAAWGVYLLLIPRVGAVGAAIGLLASLMVRHQLLLVWSQRLWPIRYDWWPVVRQLGYATMVATAALVFPVASAPLALVLHGVLLAAYSAGVWWGGVLTAQDRADLLGGLALARGWLARASSG